MREHRRTAFSEYNFVKPDEAWLEPFTCFVVTMFNIMRAASINVINKKDEYRIYLNLRDIKLFSGSDEHNFIFDSMQDRRAVV